MVLRATCMRGAAQKNRVHMDLREVLKHLTDEDCLAGKHVVRNVEVVLYVCLILFFLVLEDFKLTECSVPLGAQVHISDGLKYDVLRNVFEVSDGL